MGTPVPDGQTSFEGGQDASLPPSRLPENKVAAMVNCSTVKGVIRSRYGYERKKLKFPPGGYSYKFNKVANFKSLFEGGKFQALVSYKIGNKSYVLAVVSGVIFLIDIKTYNVQVLTLNKQTQLDESKSRINATITGRYILLHDFPSRPIIVDGFVARRSDVNKDEIPTSNLSVYNQSRTFFSNFGNEFSAGDPAGNELTPNAPITVTEIVLEGSPYLGDLYQVPSKNNSPITGLATLQGVDSSTGIGQMIAGTKEELFAFNTIDGRETWLAGKFGTSISDKAGFAGARAFTNVNSDLHFASDDGQLRSLSASRDEQKKWSRTPMSLEVQNWVSYISKELVDYSIVGYFKNKIFWGARPYRIPASRLDGKKILDVAHSGFLVLETDNVSRLGADSSPAWAGLWTGINPMDMCVIDERMFVMSKERYSRNALYEIDPELKYDRTQEGKRRQIQSTIYTREHYFQNMFALKNLESIEFGITDIRGDFAIDVDWKPSDSSNFLFWSSFKHRVPSEYREILGGEIPEKMPASFKELKFSAPDVEDGNPITEDLFKDVKRVQFRIIIKGDSWQLNEYQVMATIEPKQNETEGLNPKDLKEETQYKENYSDWSYEEFGL